LDKISVLDVSFVTQVKDLLAAEPAQDDLGRELAAAQQDIEEFEEELQFEKRHSAKLERRLNKCTSQPEITFQTDITQLRQKKYLLLHPVRNLLSKKSGLDSELSMSECVTR
jgi:septal ring factor EnvC (AmiA/AmiB activator)